MSNIHRLVPSLLLAAASSAAFAQLNVNSEVFKQDNSTFDVACTEEGLVTISGNDNEANVSGPCQIVAVIGSGNKVHIYRTAGIEVTGENNQIDWRSAAQENAKPVVKNKGGNNRIITFDEWLSANQR